MSSKKLPTEIWVQILQCLPNNDLRECRLVNRLWNLTVQGFYTNHILHIRLKQLQETHELLQSLNKHPELVPKIKIMTFMYEKIPGKRGFWLFEQDPWISVLEKCTSLLILNIYAKNPYYYLRGLEKSRKLLALEDIKLLPFRNYSPACHRHLRECRFRHIWREDLAF